MIQNRIQKNYNKLKPWAERNKIQAFRLYDRDIPEYPFIIDLYLDYLIVYDRRQEHLDSSKNHLELLIGALRQLFPKSVEKIIFKKREKQDGLKQYEKIASKEERIVIQEGELKFLVNLHDYLDTGLFLDHRPLRYEFSKSKIFNSMFRSQIKPQIDFLNLFCYTGSVSVAAAFAGAKTTSVDMSKTYLDWAQDNFKANQLNPGDHTFIQQNALEYLKLPSEQNQFYVIFLDPPTFSNSKRMDEYFEVEKDQDFLVEKSTALLKPLGKLYFSNNKRKFKLSDSISKNFRVRNISEKTIPIDFHDQKIHQCYEIMNL